MIEISALGKLKPVAALAVVALLAGACTSTSAGGDGLYAQPMGSAPVVANPTPYSTALFCLADWARSNGRPSPRIAVGRIADYTGQVGDNGRIITQGASLMAMTALGKAGARQVERYDTSVSEMEMRYSGAMLIGEGENPAGGPGEPRRLIAGSVPGSDYVIQGGITEANFNIRGSGAELGGGGNLLDNGAPTRGGVIGARSAVMNVALDLRLVDTRTQEIVDVISYQKQIVGREVSLGWFDFLNGNVFDLSVASGGQEPVQMAVRALVERAVLEIMANLYGAPGPEACLQVSGDPLFTNGPTGGYYPAYDNLGSNNADTRADPNRWNENRDPAVRGNRY